MEITDHIHFGGKLNVNMTGEINVFNTNTSENEVCLKFSANPECNATLTMHDLVFFPNITEVDIHNFQIDFTNMHMYNHTYPPLINALFRSEAKQFDEKWKNGWPLANLNPMIGFLTGWFKNTTMREGPVDGYLYAGFSMQQDVPPMEDYELQFIQ